jgi:uncharacterized membrane-anchored protein YhcB (DUF1043 family)
MQQLELFPNTKDEQFQIEEMRQQIDKTRRALFRELSESRKLYQELAHEFQILKLNICKGRLPL